MAANTPTSGDSTDALQRERILGQRGKKPKGLKPEWLPNRRTQKKIASMLKK